GAYALNRGIFTRQRKVIPLWRPRTARPPEHFVVFGRKIPRTPDLNQLGNLLHGEEQFVSADAGYQGAPQREELAEVDVDWLIAERPGKVKTLKQHPRKNKTAINIEYMKASIRARVEHPFRIIKRQFGFVKARYKGLLKNDNQLAMLFTLANLFRVDQMIRQWERSQ
uniref:transposase n=2 Tax=Klebsiella pneumoniae TaxID=573 RepID=UPI001D0E2C40